MRRSGMGALHIASIFLSAFLLFLVQPMAAKALLPGFGGSPAVWGTCLVAFQALLLGGYAWADRLRRLPPRRQLALQAVAVLAPIALLPPVLRTAPPPATAWPIPALLLALAGSVAAPFFALATNSTLVQHWYGRTVGKEPYFLYAASNLGSLLALAAYPFAVEPRLGLTQQRSVFSAGYLAFAILTLLLAWRANTATASAAATAAAPPDPATSDGGAPRRQRARWALLAAVPSGLLVATTLHLTMDVAAVPLLWVAPLALYLVTFVLVFLPRRRGGLGVYPRGPLLHATRVLLLLSFAALHGGLGELADFSIALGLALATLFAACWLCHGELVAARPPPERLGEFYLWVSAGGLAGGAFCNLVAPFLFDSVGEYPLFLAAAALVTAPIASLRSRAAAAVAAVCALAIAVPSVAVLAGLSVPWGLAAAPLALLVFGIATPRRPERFALASLAIAAYWFAPADADLRTLESGRSFFGVVRVLEQTGDVRMMLHGTTVHGHEFRKVDYPIGYYYPDAPIARTVSLAPEGGRIGIVGLGTGAIAKLAQPGQEVDFYEIDPIVEPMARTWFTYLNFSKARVRTVLGDARLTLARAPDGSYDLLAMDAFTSDAIPVHLITREAIELYLSKLAPGGRLLVHVSNRHLDVTPVVRGAANALGLAGVRRLWVPSEAQAGGGAFASHVLVLARSVEELAPLEEEGWVPLGHEPAVEWTDERSSLLEVLGRAPPER